MQHHRSSFQALFGAVRFWSMWGVLAAALAGCGEEHCDLGGDNCYYSSEQRDDDAPPCSSLGEEDCRRSGRCFVDSVCKAPACSGVSCSDRCELVRTCVEY